MSIKEEKVEYVMSYPLTMISLSSSVKEAAQIMIEKRIRRLPVNQDGRVVGIVTAADLIRCLPNTPKNMYLHYLPRTKTCLLITIEDLVQIRMRE